jgi:putative peptidoglycan lipid II flippase
MIRGALPLMFGNIASKVLGLAREVLFAAWFGTSEVAAAFRIAQSLVIISIHSLVGDTMAGGMLPLYQKLRAESDDKSRALLCIVLAQGLFIGGVVTCCMFFFASQIVDLMAPGASAPAKHLAVEMVKVMAIVAPIYIVGNTLAYIETAHGKYTTLVSRTSLANIGIILAGSVAMLLNQPIALAIGFAVVYAIFLVATINDFIRSGLSCYIFGSIALPLHPIFCKFERNTLSLLGMVLVGQGNVIAERVVASWLGTSVIPGLDYARFLTDTVTIVLAVPLGIVTLANHGTSSKETLLNYSHKISGFLLTITIPLSVLMFSGAEDLVRIIYARGAFDEHSVGITSSILRGAAAGLFATATSYLLIKSLNTASRNRETLVLTVLAAAVNVAFNLVFWRLLGTTVLGVGNTLYGLVLLGGAMTLVGLWRPLAALLWPSLVMGFLAVGILSSLPRTDVALLDLAIKGTTVVTLWAGLCVFSPAIRLSLVDRL